MTGRGFDVVLANPRGFCAGVERAIGIVETLLERFGAPVYVRHEVVHNRHVVEDLRARGAVFVRELDEVPDGANVVFSAHGVPRWVEQEGARRGLRVFDATCPLVTKVHNEVARHARAGRDVILIGHRGHPEVEGTLGRYAGTGHIHLVERPEDVGTLAANAGKGLGYVTQTTLSTDDAAEVIRHLRGRFPEVEGPKKDDICYATQNRQDAVKALARECEVILVVGSRNSSNSNRLREIAERQGARAYLLDRAEELEPAWLSGAARVGVTAGASAPEILVEGLIARLRSEGARTVRELEGQREDMHFPLPPELKAPT